MSANRHKFIHTLLLARRRKIKLSENSADTTGAKAPAPVVSSFCTCCVGGICHVVACSHNITSDCEQTNHPTVCVLAVAHDEGQASSRSAAQQTLDDTDIYDTCMQSSKVLTL